MSESDLPRCDDDGVPLEANRDVIGKILVCPRCNKVWEVPEEYALEDWYRVWEADRAELEPSLREAARRRVKAFLEARAYTTRGARGTMDKNVVTAAGNKDGEAVELLVADLEKLVEDS